MSLRIPLFGDVYRKKADGTLWIALSITDVVLLREQNSRFTHTMTPELIPNEYEYVDVAELLVKVKEQPTPEVCEHGQFHITEWSDVETLQDSGWQYIGPSPVTTASGWHIFKRVVSTCQQP